MNWQDFSPLKQEPERAWRLGVATAAAPLWATFFAVAGAGAAYWWATSWTRRKDDEPAALPAAEAKSFAPLEPVTVEPIAVEPIAAEPVEPELIAAHNPPPAPETVPSEPVDDLTPTLEVAPELIAAHTPPPSQPEPVDLTIPVEEPPHSPQEAIAAAVEAIVAKAPRKPKAPKASA